MSKIQEFHIAALNSRWYETKLLFSLKIKRLNSPPGPKRGPKLQSDLKYSQRVFKCWLRFLNNWFICSQMFKEIIDWSPQTVKHNQEITLLWIFKKAVAVFYVFILPTTLKKIIHNFNKITDMQLNGFRWDLLK